MGHVNSSSGHVATDRGYLNCTVDFLAAVMSVLLTKE